MTNEEKAALRRSMRSLPAPWERLAEGASAAAHIAAWELFHKASVIGCYVGMSWEIDTRPALDAILSCGKALALPKAYDHGILEFRRVENPAFLRPGRWNIPEPDEDSPVILPEKLSLLLIPALAVDSYGRRLGNGGGYYDRYLPKTSCPAAVLALTRQVVSAVPCGDKDYLVQWIITGGGIAPALPA